LIMEFSYINGPVTELASKVLLLGFNLG